MRSSLTPALALVLLAASAPAASAGPAAPAAPVDLVPTSCSISVPERVAVTGSTTTLQAKLGGDCPHGTLAAWSVHAPDGTDLGQLAFRRVRTSQITLPTDTAGTLGTYSLRPVYAVTAEYSQLLQGRAATTLKAGSRLSTSAPSGTGTVAVTAAYYDLVRGAFRAWPGASVEVQRGDCTTTCRWTTTSTVRTDADGQVAVPAAGDDSTSRLLLRATPTVWERLAASPKAS